MIVLVAESVPVGAGVTVAVAESVPETVLVVVAVGGRVTVALREDVGTAVMVLVSVGLGPVPEAV